MCNLVKVMTPFPFACLFFFHPVRHVQRHKRAQHLAKSALSPRCHNSITADRSRLTTSLPLSHFTRELMQIVEKSQMSVER